MEGFLGCVQPRGFGLLSTQGELPGHGDHFLDDLSRRLRAIGLLSQGRLQHLTEALLLHGVDLEAALDLISEQTLE